MTRSACAVRDWTVTAVVRTCGSPCELGRNVVHRLARRLRAARAEAEEAAMAREARQAAELQAKRGQDDQAGPPEA